MTIDKLTKKQQQHLIQFRKHWLDIGLCCKPADFDKAEEQITFFYSKLGKPKPMFFRFSSPMMCELGFVALKYLLEQSAKKKIFGDQLRDQLGDQLGGQLWGQLGGQLRDQLWGQLRDQLWGQLRGQLGGQLRDQLRDQLGDQLGGQLWGQLRGQLWGQLRGQLGGQLRDQLRGQLRDQLKNTIFYNNAFWGQQESAWVAFYKFGLEIGAKYKNDDIALLNAWGAISESACWWAPWENICIISDRPRFVSFDENRRLHNETKKAVEFSDGWGVSAWHGVRVPDEWITDRTSLTAKAALTWGNIEQRRAACEIITWAKVLDELKAKVIDTDDDEEIGELVEVTIPDIGKEKFLRVMCGTGRKFAIPMPPHIKTALEGNAWSYGIDGDTLKQLEIRT